MFDISPSVTSRHPPSRLARALESPLEFMLEQIAVSLELPDGKRKQAIERYESVGTFLDASDEFKGWFPDIFSQGSFRIGTTTKPWKESVHDLDFVVQVTPPNGQNCTPIELYNRLYRCLANDGTYAKMLSPKRRCARLTYANDFYLDILPAVADPLGRGTELLVPDRDLRCFKASNPVGYADWFKLRGEVTLLTRAFAAADSVQPVPAREDTMRPLTRAVQLIKRDRDVYCDRASAEPTISVVLTTLAGHAYLGHGDIYEAIDGILRGIWAMIPAKGRLMVLNPTNTKEDFSERWQDDPAAYRDFLAWLTEFTKDWRELQNLKGPRLQAKLHHMFGEKPTEFAFAEYGEVLRKSRDAGGLGISRAAGLVAVTQPAAAAVRPHTFHGQDD